MKSKSCEIENVLTKYGKIWLTDISQTSPWKWRNVIQY